MEQHNYLIDTNALIDYLGKKLPVRGMNLLSDIIDAIPCVSVITKIEVLGFNASEEHTRLLRDFMNDANVFDLTNEIVEATIHIRKNHKIKLPDAIIAATALINNSTLISRNTADFKNISGLDTLDPHIIT